MENDKSTAVFSLIIIYLAYNGVIPCNIDVTTQIVPQQVSRINCANTSGSVANVPSNSTLMIALALWDI